MVILTRTTGGVGEQNTNMLKITQKTSSQWGYYRSILQNFSPYAASTFSAHDFHTSIVSAQDVCPPNENLPKLPVPPLQKTFYKYMRSIKPLVTEEEYRKHCEVMVKFVDKNGEGPKLQKLLEDRAKKMENWLEDWWLHHAYLGNRLPVAVYSSPSLLMPFQQFCDKCDQLKYAAKLVLAAFNYMAQINDNKLKQDMMGKKPLDMCQYRKIFGTSRIPGTRVDKLQFNHCPTHIIVCHNNQFFRLDLCVNGEMLNYEQLVELLESVVSNSECKMNPIGILTADDRDSWGAVYQHLVKDGCNQHALKTIQSSAFMLCLDKSVPGGKDQLTHFSKQLVHGFGSKHNGGNRWFDKTINFIVSEDGGVGMLYEHSPAEGQPIAVMADYIVNCIQCFDPACLEPACGIKCPEKLTFNVTKEVLDGITHAEETLNELVDNFQLNCIHFKHFGKGFIKCMKMSPDSFLQMIFQATFYRMHKVPGATYESAATRLYVGGRTETIRSCSLESVYFAKLFLDRCTSDEDKIKSLHDAVNGHKKYTIEAVHGFGVDRHLLGLRLIAKENKMPEPALYSEMAFKKSSHFRLSTSQVATKCYGLMAYGPGVENGYSLCYNPREDDMFFAIGAFKSNNETDVNAFGKALTQTLLEVRELLCKNEKSKL